MDPAGFLRLFGYKRKSYVVVQKKWIPGVAAE